MVLCIHRLGRDVGRDEIYCFCEALLNSSYDKGIIICTGRLSRDALKVIDSLNGRVEVWGLPRFREMANEAGVKLGEMTYDTEDVALPAMTKDKITEYVVSALWLNFWALSPLFATFLAILVTFSAIISYSLYTFTSRPIAMLPFLSYDELLEEGR
jgi:hypothetical protein